MIFPFGLRGPGGAAFETPTMASDSLRISVVMPNFNHSQFISTALHAVLNQSLPPAEVLVIDDCSTDSSVEVVRGFMDRHSNLRLLQNKKRLGPIANCNLGIAETTGDCLYFAAADDWILPGLFEKTVAALRRFPQAGLCWWDPTTFNEKTGALNFNYRMLSPGPEYFSGAALAELFRRGLITTFMGGTWTLLKRCALAEIGNFREDLPHVCDVFANLLISFRHGCCYVPDCLSVFRFHPQAEQRKWRRNIQRRRHLIGKMIEIFKSKEFEDLYPLFKRSDVLWQYSLDGLFAVWDHPEHHDLLTLNLIRRAFLQKAVQTCSNVAPPEIKQLAFRVRDVLRRSARALRGLPASTIRGGSASQLNSPGSP